MRIRWQHVPARLTVGAFVLDQGLGNFRVDEQSAAQMRDWAAGTYPPLRRLPPRRFAQLLAAGETTLGAAVLLPLVRPALAGAGLSVFAGSLLGLYATTPGMRRPGSIFPPATASSWPRTAGCWV